MGEDAERGLSGGGDPALKTQGEGGWGTLGDAMRTRALWVVAAMVLTAPWGTRVREAEACAPAPREGEQVFIAEESAVIHWDPARRIETFVRRARFETSAGDFGFLVPTPSAPTLAEADERLFDQLDALVRPREEWRTERDVAVGISCMLLLARSARHEASPSLVAQQSVRVLSAQTVAGYDAVVLEADNADALAQWLGSHGYASSPTLARWLQPYVTHHWKITAFRIRKPDPSNPQPPATSPVRMTFQTDRPFYPYREPEDQQRPRAGATRGLRVHVVSTEPMQGTLGEGGRWPGALTYRSSAGGLSALLGARLGSELSGELWLSTFDDRSSPRPGTDEVYFSATRDRAPVTPPPIVRVRHDTIPIPLDWIAVPTLLGVVIWRRARNKRAA